MNALPLALAVTSTPTEILKEKLTSDLPPALFREKVRSWETSQAAPAPKKEREVHFAKPVIKRQEAFLKKGKHDPQLKKLDKVLKKEFELGGQSFILRKFLRSLKREINSIEEISLAGGAVKDVLRLGNKHLASITTLRIYLNDSSFDTARDAVSRFFREEVKAPEVYKYLKLFESNTFWGFSLNGLHVTFYINVGREHIFETDAIVIRIDEALDESPQEVKIRSVGSNLDNALFGLESKLIETTRADQITGKRGFFELALHVTLGEKDPQNELCQSLYANLLDNYSSQHDAAFKNDLERYLKDHVEKKGRVLFLANLVTLIHQAKGGPDKERWNRMIDECLIAELDISLPTALPSLRLWFFLAKQIPASFHYSTNSRVAPLIKTPNVSFYYELPQLEELINAVFSSSTFDQEFPQISEALATHVKTSFPIPTENIQTELLKRLSSFLHAIRGTSQEALLHGCCFHQRVLSTHPEIAAELDSKERILFYARELKGEIREPFSYESPSVDFDTLPYLQGPWYDHRVLQMSFLFIKTTSNPWAQISALPLFWPCRVRKEDLTPLINGNPLTNSWYENFSPDDPWKALHQLLKSCLEIPNDSEALAFAYRTFLNAYHLGVIPEKEAPPLAQSFILALAHAGDAASLERGAALWSDDSFPNDNLNVSVTLWCALAKQGMLAKDQKLLESFLNHFFKNPPSMKTEGIKEWIASALKLKEAKGVADLLIELRSRGTLTFQDHHAIYEAALNEDLFPGAVEDGFFKDSITEKEQALFVSWLKKATAQSVKIIEQLPSKELFFKQKAAQEQMALFFIKLITQNEITQAERLFDLFSPHFKLKNDHAATAISLLAKNFSTLASKVLKAAKSQEDLAKSFRPSQALIPFLCKEHAPLALEVVTNWESNKLSKVIRASSRLALLKAWNRTGKTTEEAKKWWEENGGEVYGDQSVANQANDAAIAMIQLLTQNPKLPDVILAKRILDGKLIHKKEEAYLALLKGYCKLPSCLKSAANLLAGAQLDAKTEIIAYQTVIPLLCESKTLDLILEAKALLIKRFATHFILPSDQIESYFELVKRVFKEIIQHPDWKNQVPAERIKECKEFLEAIKNRKEFSELMSVFAKEIILLFDGEIKSMPSATRIFISQLAKLLKNPLDTVQAVLKVYSFDSSDEEWTDEKLKEAKQQAVQLLKLPLVNEESVNLVVPALQKYCLIFFETGSPQLFSYVVSTFSEIKFTRKASKETLAKMFWQLLLQELKEGRKTKYHVQGFDDSENETVEMAYPGMATTVYQAISPIYTPPTAEIEEVRHYISQRVEKEIKELTLVSLDLLLNRTLSSGLFPQSRILDFYLQFARTEIKKTECYLTLPILISLFQKRGWPISEELKVLFSLALKQESEIQQALQNITKEKSKKEVLRHLFTLDESYVPMIQWLLQEWEIKAPGFYQALILAYAQSPSLKFHMLDLIKQIAKDGILIDAEIAKVYLQITHEFKEDESQENLSLHQSLFIALANNFPPQEIDSLCNELLLHASRVVINENKQTSTGCLLETFQQVLSTWTSAQKGIVILSQLQLFIKKVLLPTTTLCQATKQPGPAIESAEIMAHFFSQVRNKNQEKQAFDFITKKKNNPHAPFVAITFLFHLERDGIFLNVFQGIQESCYKSLFSLIEKAPPSLPLATAMEAFVTFYNGAKTQKAHLATRLNYVSILRHRLEGRPAPQDRLDKLRKSPQLSDEERKRLIK